MDYWDLVLINFIVVVWLVVFIDNVGVGKF